MITTGHLPIYGDDGRVLRVFAVTVYTSYLDLFHFTRKLREFGIDLMRYLDIPQLGKLASGLWTYPNISGVEVVRITSADLLPPTLTFFKDIYYLANAYSVDDVSVDFGVRNPVYRGVYVRDLAFVHKASTTVGLANNEGLSEQDLMEGLRIAYQFPSDFEVRTSDMVEWYNIPQGWKFTSLPFAHNQLYPVVLDKTTLAFVSSPPPFPDLFYYKYLAMKLEATNSLRSPITFAMEASEGRQSVADAYGQYARIVRSDIPVKIGVFIGEQIGYNPSPGRIYVPDTGEWYVAMFSAVRFIAMRENLPSNIFAAIGISTDDEL